MGLQNLDFLPQTFPTSISFRLSDYNSRDPLQWHVEAMASQPA